MILINQVANYLFRITILNKKKDLKYNVVVFSEC